MGNRVPRWAALALAAAALSSGELPPARADIPGVVYNSGTGHWYKWVSGTTTWANAKSGAEGLGGYLATITSAAEQSWLGQSIIPPGSTSCLGGTDETTEGTWAWITGEPWSYTYWNGGEPNNAGNEDYLAWNANTTWNDIIGTSGGTTGYVVEWNADPNIPPPPAAPTTLAGVLGGNNHVNLTWTDNSTNESAFELERKPAVGGFAPLASLASGTVAYDDGDTFPGSTYTYRVKAVNAGGTSAWSNEVTVGIPAAASAPAAPSGLFASDVTATSITLGWTDNSDDETGFEVLKKNAAGVFVVFTTTGVNAESQVVLDLAPDTEYSWRVRAVNQAGTSGHSEATATTDPTLAIATIKADLKDTAKLGKDSLKLQAGFEFLPASDGTFDPVGEGITVRAGTGTSPLVVVLPPGLEWKVTATKATWKSAKGMLPKYKVEVLLADRVVKVTVTGVTLAVPPANPMRVSIGIGDDAGTENLDWPLKKPGLFQYR